MFTGVLLERDAMITKKTIVLLDESTDYLTQSCAMAVDNDFLMLEPEPYLPDQIKLFSRISPENKALVVKRFKEQLKVQYDAQ